MIYGDGSDDDDAVDDDGCDGDVCDHVFDHDGGDDSDGDDDYPTEKVQQTPKPPAQVPFKVSCLNSISFHFPVFL